MFEMDKDASDNRGASRPATDNRDASRFAIDDWSWTGMLLDLEMAQLYARCQGLRFTGRMRLWSALVPVSEPAEIEALWVGGEVADLTGAADESELLSFPAGPGSRFALEQGLPDLDGMLLDQTELRGELAPGLMQRLYEICAKARLSAVLSLQSSAGAAEVRFTHGRVEAATIDGAPQAALQALAQLSGWEEGSFVVQLLPCFRELAQELGGRERRDTPADGLEVLSEEVLGEDVLGEEVLSEALTTSAPGTAADGGALTIESQRATSAEPQRQPRSAGREFDVTGVVAMPSGHTGRYTLPPSKQSPRPSSASARAPDGAVPMALPGRSVTGSFVVVAPASSSVSQRVSEPPGMTVGTSRAPSGVSTQAGEARPGSGAPSSRSTGSHAVLTPSSRSPVSGRPARLPGLTQEVAVVPTPATTPAATPAGAASTRPAEVSRARQSEEARARQTEEARGLASALAAQAGPLRSRSGVLMAVPAPRPRAATRPQRRRTGPWVRAGLTGVVLGTLAFLMALGVRGLTQSGGARAARRAAGGAAAPGGRGRLGDEPR